VAGFDAFANWLRGLALQGGERKLCCIGAMHFDAPQCGKMSTVASIKKSMSKNGLQKTDFKKTDS
jgi:hypothetical protein